jgi:hypothetical protein
MITDLERGFIIGMIEADGWVKKITNKDNTARAIVITNTNKTIIDYLVNILAKEIKLGKVRNQNYGNQEVYRVCIYRKRGFEFIMKIYEEMDYHSVKRERLKLLLESY